MSAQYVKCQQCGSSAITELKSNFYVCNYCEAVFRLSSDESESESEFCECGDLVSGKCTSCGIRACAHHLLWNDEKLLCRHCYPKCEWCGENRRGHCSTCGKDFCNMHGKGGPQVDPFTRIFTSPPYSCNECLHNQLLVTDHPHTSEPKGHSAFEGGMRIRT